jgi:hypothetical protein
VRRRICVVGAALSAGSLALGVVSASAAAPASVTKVTCKTSTGISVSQGDTAVTPPVAKGIEYGPARCGKGLGNGVQTVVFNVPDSGDRVGQFQTYFATGTLRGKFTLIPQPGSFSDTSFNETDYEGTMTITGGTGGFTGAKGTAKMVCKSIDGIHTTCTNRLKLTQL